MARTSTLRRSPGRRTAGCPQCFDASPECLSADHQGFPPPLSHTVATTVPDAKGHTLETTFADGPWIVDGDKTRLVQAVANLLTNAAKYSRAGRPHRGRRRGGGGAAKRSCAWSTMASAFRARPCPPYGRAVLRARSPAWLAGGDRQHRRVATRGASVAVLVQDRWHGLSTNRVAREAGVSVGSLYQYFPNKDALVHALVVRLAEEMGDRLVELGRTLADAPLEEGIDAIVRAALDAARADVPLFRAVLVELPRIGALEVFDRLNRRTADALAEWISLRRHELDVADASMTAHVLVTALDALTDHALVFRPELLESARFERELRKLVAGYLGVRVRSRAASASRKR